MSTAKPLFRFSMWAVGRPNDSYYVTNWDRKIAVEVVAATRQEAINKADAMLGDAGSHRYWTFSVRTIVDHEVPVPA